MGGVWGALHLNSFNSFLRYLFLSLSVYICCSMGFTHANSLLSFALKHFEVKGTFCERSPQVGRYKIHFFGNKSSGMLRLLVYALLQGFCLVPSNFSCYFHFYPSVIIIKDT